jgi:hypothetical protein
MKKNLIKISLITLAGLLLILATSCTDERDYLFNGKNLDGWTIFVSDSTVNPEDFFYVNEGVIETIGVPNGYLRTVKEYSNYHLHVEWRYPENPTNSGIFLHTSGPDIWTVNHFQGQLKHGFAGDFIVNGVGLSATVLDTVYTSTEKTKPLLPKLHASNEKQAGEWNSYDITCKGNTIELRVNGLLQNVATDCSLSTGNIGLQAEGSKIQFRNLWLEELK